MKIESKIIKLADTENFKLWITETPGIITFDMQARGATLHFSFKDWKKFIDAVRMTNVGIINYFKESI